MTLRFDSFPKAEPGDNGLNNAAILTFSRDPIDALVKEMTQNSIDALKAGQNKLKIRMSVKNITKSEILNWESLDKIFEQLIDYWKLQKQTEFTNYFRAAQAELRKDNLSVFIFEDYNTKGLYGDITTGNFKRLLLDEGVQGERPSQGALGGFGIGKNAFFSLTPMQTVFYSSFNDEGYKFMGVTKLAEYVDSGGIRKSNRVYYGDWSKTKSSGPYNVSHINDLSKVPAIFRRTENGLSSFAIGVKHTTEWKTLVKQALVRNYWYRFINNGIEAEIVDDSGTETLNGANFMTESTKVFEAETDKSVLAYISAYTEPQTDGVYEKEIDLHDFGKIKIHLREQDANSDDYPDKLLYIRDGMMIMQEAKNVGALPKKIAGVIFCENQKGNEILSKMEPPAHDNFEPSLLPRKTSTLSEKDGIEILKKIRKAKVEAINMLKEKYTVSSKSSEVVDDILSGFSNSSSSGSGGGISNTSQNEEFFKRKREAGNTPGVSAVNSVIVVSNQPDTAGGNDGKGGGAGGGKPGEGKREGRSGEGPGDGDGIGGTGKLGGKKGRRKTRKRNDAEISATVFFKERNSDINIYYLVVRTDKDLLSTHLSFSQFGDDGGNSAPTSELVEVSDDKITYPYSLDNSIFTIKQVNLKAGQQNIFYLKFNETIKSAFKFINR